MVEEVKYIKFGEVPEAPQIAVPADFTQDQIKEYLKSGNHLGVNIHYLDETKQMLGTGGGILNALNFLGDDPFWLVNADLYSDYEIPNKKKLEPSLEGHLILVPNPPHNSDGDFCLEGDNVYLSHEKNFYTYSGISLLSPKLFKNIRKKIFSLEPFLLNLDRSIVDPYNQFYAQG